MLDLEKFVDYNKGTDDLRSEAKFRSELMEIICAIINSKDDDAIFVESDEFVTKVDIKVKKSKKKSNWSYGTTCFYPDKEGYWIKLNKTNVKKIQDYINKEFENDFRKGSDNNE